MCLVSCKGGGGGDGERCFSCSLVGLTLAAAPMPVGYESYDTMLRGYVAMVWGYSAMLGLGESVAEGGGAGGAEVGGAGTILL